MNRDDGIQRWKHFLMLCLLIVFGAADYCPAGETPQREGVLAAIFNDAHVVESAWSIHQLAAKLPAEERFQFLSGWVLPNQRHSTIRLNVDFTPTHPAGADTDELGGELISPALDLIQVADELGQLDALQARVRAISTGGPLQQKKRLAILTLILIRQGKIDKAVDQIDKFLPLSSMDTLDDVQHRSAEAALYWVGREIPKLKESLVGTVTTIARRKMELNVWPIWNRQFQSVVAEAYVHDQQFKLNQSDAGHWSSASVVMAKSRGGGVPDSRWLCSPGQALNTVSHDNDMLYFQSPLRGEFQVECNLDPFDWRESEVLVAGKWVALVYTRVAFKVGDVRGKWTLHPFAPKLGRPRDSLHYRVAVRDSTAATFAMGRPLHTRSLTRDYDPWVAIRNDYKHGGKARDVRITGSPVIPDEIRLTTDSELQGWSAYYGGAVGRSSGHWQQLYARGREADAADDVSRDGGIFASRKTSLPAGCFHEEVLFYHRPMLEDGTIEYEFFYEPGKSIVHPAMDRMCFLLQRSGVKLHWLTDGVYDRTELAPDNMQPLNTNPVELDENAWNRLSLTLVGDEVKILLNESVIAQQRLNANNQRRFGLFHYTDLSEIRVRNVRWKGKWPKQLPSVTNQDLADHTADFLDDDADQLQAVFKYDFMKNGVVSDKISIIRGAIGSQVIDTPKGVQSRRSGHDDGYENATIAPGIRVEGDFDITVRYEDFNFETAPGGDAALMLTALLDNDTNDEFFVTRRHKHGEQIIEDVVQCAVVRREAEGEKRDYFVTQIMEERSGCLRLARRGDNIYFLTSEGDSPNFRLRGTRTFSTAPIKLDGIRLVNQMYRQGQSSVVWKDVVVRGEKISGPGVGRVDERVTQLNTEREKLPKHVLYDLTKTIPNQASLFRWDDTRPFDAEHPGMTVVAQGADSWESAGACTRQPIHGDFDITAEFETVNLAKPAAGQQTAIYLQLDLRDEGVTQVNALFERSESGHTAASGQIRRAKRGGGYNYENDAAVSMKDVTTLRVARRGRTFTIIARQRGAEQESILSVHELSDVPIPIVRLMLHTGGAGRESEILAKRFEVHAENYDPAGQIP